MTFKNLQAAETALARFTPPNAHITRRDITLKRLKPLMPLIGNPQQQLRVIHIAGTSGKTSTSYYLAALLTAGGSKTGLAVSPHVDTITERIQINGRNIADKDFCRELSIFLELIKDAAPRPSYFELMHAFTLWVMVRQKVDYVVVETGVGGLHDATNINNRPDKVCVITDIGFDHMDLLGKTLPAITSQKIGIVHDGNHVFMYKQDPQVMATAEHWTNRHHARLHVTTETAERRAYQHSLDGMPAYQQRNWLLAYYVYQYIQNRDGLPSLTSKVLRSTQSISIPGRMDSRIWQGKTLLMDGAHNYQKMQAFIDSFERLYPNVKPALLISLKEGKDYEKLVPLLARLPARIITTEFDSIQDTHVGSMDAKALAQAFKKAGVKVVESIADNRAAFQALMAAPENVCLITGSFYLIGQIRNNEHIS